MCVKTFKRKVWISNQDLQHCLLLQYHIWLSADSHGVLVLVPNYPVLNILLTSFIFVCASHEIHAVTAQLMPYFVPLGMKTFRRRRA
jgi:hypothetical protein